MEYSITPSHFFVGDRAKLIVKLDESCKIRCTSLDVAKLTKSESLTIHEVSIVTVEGKTRIVVDFTPWQIGEVNFPSLYDAGCDVELPTIKVPSILQIEGVAQTLQEAREPILPDGTVMMLYKGIGLFIVLLLAFTLGFLWLKKRGRACLTKLSNDYALLLFAYRIKRLRRELKRTSRYSKGENYTMDLPAQANRKMAINTWGKIYENAFRKCLASIYRTNVNWDALTYSEMEEMIGQRLKNEICGQDRCENISKVFHLLSLMRFAEKRGGLKDASRTCTEDELLSLSLQFITLHKKRSNKSCEIKETIA